MVFAMFNETVPCCYDMDMNGFKLILKVHEDFARRMPINGSKVEEMKKRFGFGNFSDLKGNFGFDDTFLREKNPYKFIKFEIPIPTVSDLGGPWNNLKRTTMSLVFFFDMARYAYRDKTSSNQEQLLTIFIAVNDEDWQALSLMGDFSPSLCNWIEDRMNNSDLRNIKETMSQTYRRLWGKDGRMFQAYIRDEGQLVLCCPNDGQISIFSPHGEKRKRYMEFTSNRLNNAAELMTLTSGLFALNGIARRDGAGSF